MNKIYKYRLNMMDPKILMPVDAFILSAKEQDNEITIWAIVPVGDGVKTHQKEFEVITTGAAVPDSTRDRHIIFIDTVLLDGGKFVAHIFERIQENS